MICLQCDNEEFLPKQDAVIEQEFRGDTLRIQTPASVCSKCGWTTVDLQQADELRKRTADAYRKKHGLLTSEEIKAFRKLLRKTQREFAAFLGVGEASVKRWETWLVQEKGNDNLIRMKCEKALLDQLAQKAATNVWFSTELPLAAEPIPGFIIQAGSAKHVVPSRRAVPHQLPEPQEESQMQLCDVTNPETSGLSPPDRFADGAFSFSTPSPERFQTEGVEKENATQLEHMDRNWRIADYGNNPPTFALAA